MKRSTRREMAEETVAITRRGYYEPEPGRVVDLCDAVARCLASTRFISAEEAVRLCGTATTPEARGPAATVEVVAETTLAGIARLLAAGQGPVAALNFASAKNAGGGFLNGSEAQEESLARSSALYESLLTAEDFYLRHRASRSTLYSDAMILSPACPIFRDDDGALLHSPHLASFITSAAPNARAAADNARHELQLIPETLLRRAECVLALAASEGYRQLVLGAWGCGVFRNDPAVVAKSFASHLRAGGPWARRFDRVVFSIYDSSPEKETLAAFQRELG
ncbi:MAG: TIGR02452 family protein [Myxococcales bacterium]|nr:TIGR02452 family protein [Myxococcales bacterium]